MIKKWLRRRIRKWLYPVKQGRDPRRSFTHTQQVEMWMHQDGKCDDCHKELDLRTVIYHHIIPWYKGGKTIVGNGSALCPDCHMTRTFKDNLQSAEETRQAATEGEKCEELDRSQLA